MHTSLCGTDPPFGNAYIVLDQSCPCSGDFVFFDNADQATCGDGNWTIIYPTLPAGIYYSPVLAEEGSIGAYTWNITAGEGSPPADVCGPGNGDCCRANGSPGCEDERCCEAICAADAYCCDSTWDQICADAAIASCPEC